MVFSFRKKNGKGSSSTAGADPANQVLQKSYEEMDDDDRSYDFVEPAEERKSQRLATNPVTKGDAAALPDVMPVTPGSDVSTPPKTPNQTPKAKKGANSGLFNRFRGSGKKKKVSAVTTPSPSKPPRTPSKRVEATPRPVQSAEEEDENTPPVNSNVTSYQTPRGATRKAESDSIEILSPEEMRRQDQRHLQNELFPPVKSNKNSKDQESAPDVPSPIDPSTSMVMMMMQDDKLQPNSSRMNDGTVSVGNVSVVDELLEEDDFEGTSLEQQIVREALRKEEERTRRLRMEREEARRRVEREALGMKPPVVHDDEYIPGMPITVDKSQQREKKSKRKEPQYSSASSSPETNSRATKQGSAFEQQAPRRTREEIRSVGTGISSAYDADTYNSDGTNFVNEFRNALDETVQRVVDTFRCAQSNGRAISAREILRNPTGVMSLFYDHLCTAQDFRNSPERPYYNEDFCRKWLEKMTTGILDPYYRSSRRGRTRHRGMEMLYLQAPNSPGNEDANWKGRSVRVVIATGSTGSLLDIQPKLEWATSAGGRTSHIVTTSVPLLRIHSILTSGDTDTIVDNDNINSPDVGVESCFLTITSESGDVHMFEANSVEERDELVNGLRNVIARLSFHLMTGDATASVELYKDDEGLEDGDLPSLPNPRLNMNRIAHAMLD